jgi:flagellar transcriptional activator FlhD
VIDIISLNRQFLIMAREAASSKSGELVSGLSRHVLEKLATLTVEQIDVIARQSGVSLFRLRLTEAEVDRLLSLDGGRRQGYLLNVVSVEDR